MNFPNSIEKFEKPDLLSVVLAVHLTVDGDKGRPVEDQQKDVETLEYALAHWNYHPNNDFSFCVKNLIQCTLEQYYNSEWHKEDMMLNIEGKFFRCRCGCNCFRKSKFNSFRYKCNACQETYTSEE